MKSKKNRKTSGDKLLDAEENSLKQRYIFLLRRNYLMRKMIWYVIFAILFEVTLSIILSVATTLSTSMINIILTITVILIGISIFTLASKIRTGDAPKMEDYVRAKFDKDYGAGAYDKAMKNADRVQ